MNRPNVLVVDQDEDLRNALVTMLEEKGYEVHAVASRRRGFDLLDELSPDLLILDDPGMERTYRMVWLREGHADTRVELLDLQPDLLRQQLDGVLKIKPAAA